MPAQPCLHSLAMPHFMPWPCLRLKPFLASPYPHAFPRLKFKPGPCQRLLPLRVVRCAALQGKTSRWAIAWSFAVDRSKSTQPLQRLGPATAQAEDADGDAPAAASVPADFVMEPMKVKHSVIFELQVRGSHEGEEAAGEWVS